MYVLRYDARIEKELRTIAQKDQLRILQKTAALKTNPRAHGVEKLEAAQGYRLRVGDYRVLFHIDDDSKTVTVHHVKHRREAYR